MLCLVSFTSVHHLRYQPFSDVPLGIKAVVAAIYEPPQTSSSDGVQLLDDSNEKVKSASLGDIELQVSLQAVDTLCNWLGLRRVGWIFTDLWSADQVKGTVHCTRHKVDYYYYHPIFFSSTCPNKGTIHVTCYNSACFR